MRIVIASIVFALLAAPARAAITADDLAALGDADYARREAATRRLLADESVTRADLARALRAAATAEQRHRLLTLARHHVLRLERARLTADIARAAGETRRLGALGLTHAAVISDDTPQLKQSAVRVTDTLPGFPAYAVLEHGDLILAIAGNPIGGPGLPPEQIRHLFINAIQGLPAGATAKLTVHRAGRSHEVKLTVADYAVLDEMYENPGELKSRYVAIWEQFKREVAGEK